MALIGDILILLLNVYLWIILAYVIVSWLIAFGVLHMGNPQAQRLVEALQRLTDPVMKPVQKYIPPIAGIDLSPIVVIVGIQILKYIVAYIFY